MSFLHYKAIVGSYAATRAGRVSKTSSGTMAVRVSTPLNNNIVIKINRILVIYAMARRTRLCNNNHKQYK